MYMRILKWMISKPWSAIIVTFLPMVVIIALSFVYTELPTFLDPQLGFSTRDTYISKRSITWENLMTSLKPSGSLLANPGDIVPQNISLISNKIKFLKIHGSSRRKDSHGQKFPHLRYSLDQSFCGFPDTGYVHLIFKSKSDLLSYESLRLLCKFEQQLKSIRYQYACIRNRNGCCKIWSLVNYVALVNNRNSCTYIQENDVEQTKRLFLKCAKHKEILKESVNCWENQECTVPMDCVAHNLMHIMFNYLTTVEYLSKEQILRHDTTLYETAVFLPVVRGDDTKSLYHEIAELKISTLNHDVTLAGMNFGLKTVFFEEALFRDMWLLLVGALIVLFFIYIYTSSLILTFLSITANVVALFLAYACYTFLLNLDFFPFINLLAAIVIVGIGTDGTFICHKVWCINKANNDNESLITTVDKTVRSAFMCIFLTNLTTFVAFISSYVSTVTVIRCFSIYAALAIAINFVLMLLWLPPAMVIYNAGMPPSNQTVKTYWWMSDNMHRILSRTLKKCLLLEKMALLYLLKLRKIWLIILSAIGSIGFAATIWSPGLQFPTVTDTVLLDRSHLFEQYETRYQNHFIFGTKHKQKEYEQLMPLRFVWGVLPIDNGDLNDPLNIGSLSVDYTFDISLPSSQQYLYEFCSNLRKQPFFNANGTGPMLLNCFIDTFVKSMNRSCIEPFTLRDVSPCCNTVAFPFEADIFKLCILDEVHDIYLTPAKYRYAALNAGPKFSRMNFPTIYVVIVEYESSVPFTTLYTPIQRFYREVNDWFTTQQRHAPVGMRNGWFISDLDLFDLQEQLFDTMIHSLLICIVSVFVILLVVTQNPVASLLGIFVSATCVSVTLAILVLTIDWKLDVTECVTCSIAIGLSVDLTLHYISVYNKYMLEEDAGSNAVHSALKMMIGPSTMSTLTTITIGGAMVVAEASAYRKTGIFLIVLAGVSWSYAVFFLSAILFVVRPKRYDFTCMKFVTVAADNT